MVEQRMSQRASGNAYRFVFVKAKTGAPSSKRWLQRNPLFDHSSDHLKRTRRQRHQKVIIFAYFRFPLGRSRIVVCDECRVALYTYIHLKTFTGAKWHAMRVGRRSGDSMGRWPIERPAGRSWPLQSARGSRSTPKADRAATTNPDARERRERNRKPRSLCVTLVWPV